MKDIDKRRVEEAGEFVQKKKELFEKLEQFLDVQLGDGCDWPEVDHDDFVELHNIVREITDLKWKRDCDNDSVIRFGMTNRKTHYQVPWVSIPSTDPYEGKHELGDEEMRALSGLMNWTANQIGHKVNVALHEKYEEDKKKKKVA